MKKRLYLLSALQLMVCGQMWADYSNGKPDYGTRCNDNAPTKTVIVDGVMYSLYGNQNYTYTYEKYTYGTSESSDYAVAVYAEKDDTRSELTIKSTVQDGNTTYTVVAIGEQFFWYNKSATKLTIPATVQTLETFALEDNTSNLSEIVIEDSENKLECYRTTDSYGAFSWNKGLKNVYIGRDLHAKGGEDYYYYAPFYKGDFSDLEVTLGPLVGCISHYTFYNNSIKSIKAMPQTPPTCGIDAFGGVTNSIPVYVSYKSKSAYTSASGWSTFTNYVHDKDLCKADALNDLDAEAGQNPSAAVLAIVSDYKGQVNNAASGDDVVAKLNAGKAAIQLQKAKETAIAALNTEAGDSPSPTVAGVRDTWIANVNNATTIAEMNTQKTNGIAAIQLQKAKEAAIAALSEAATDYPSATAEEIVETYIGKINAATSITNVTKEKEAGIQALKDAKALQDAKPEAIAALNAEAGDSPSQAVAELRDTWIANVNNATTIAEVNTQKTNGIAAIQLQKAKEAAITALSEAATAYPSDVAAGIVSTYTGIINAATSTTGVTKEKEAGIKALENAYLAQKKLERLLAMDAYTIAQGTDVDDSYLIDDEVEFVFNGDKVEASKLGGTYTLSETDTLELTLAHTFKLKANQDPNHTSNYYSTFYTSEGAYKVPADGSATAYAGTVESGEKTDVLKLADIGNIIHKKEAVILRASQSDITLMPSCNKAAASTESILEGTDVEKKLETNQYALSLGQNGVGFYLWDGKKIGANKTYLTLDGVAQAKAFTFMFDDGTTTAIESLTPALSEGEGAIYNLNGIRVNNGYKGIVIKNGKKVYQK